MPNDLRKRLLKLYGMANAFRLIDIDDSNLVGQLVAAKETGLLMYTEIKELIALIPVSK